MEKQCTSCKIVKSVKEFGRCGKYKAYKNHECVECATKEKKRKSLLNPTMARRLNNNAAFKKYGITREEYERLIDKQSNKCKICNKVAKLSIDHCHESGIVRGLLCSQCNSGLGLFKDNIRFLSSAIEYLSIQKKHFCIY